MRTAIMKSYNIPAVLAMEKITPKVGVEYLKKFGFTSILDEPKEIPEGSGDYYTDENLLLPWWYYPGCQQSGTDSSLRSHCKQRNLY